MAAALTAQITVVYEAAAPADCPGVSALVARTNAILGRRALEPGPALLERRARGADVAPTRFEVRLGRDGTRRTARVVASGDLWGSRELSDGGESCEGLAEAVVTTLVLTIESGSVDERRGSASPEEAAEPWRVEASVGALGTLGLLKGLHPVGWAGAQLDLTRRIGVGLGFGYVVPSSFSSDGFDVELGLFFGQAEACASTWTKPQVSLRLCAGGALGSLSASAQGVENSSPRRRPWVAASAGLLASGPSKAGVGWWGRLGGWVPLRRQGFSVDGVDGVDGAGVVFEPSPVAVGVGGGLRWSNW